MDRNNTFFFEQASRYLQNVLKTAAENEIGETKRALLSNDSEIWKLTSGHKLEVRKMLAFMFCFFLLVVVFS